MRCLAPWILINALFLLAPRAYAEGPALHITRAQFQLYRDYQDALADPRVQKIKPSERLNAIARNFHVKPRELQAAVSVGEQEADRIAAAEIASIKGAFDGTPLAGRVGEVRVDASKGHIIAYVEWLNADPTKLEQEACWAAARAVKAAPLVGTFDLYAQDSAEKQKRVFSALIDADRAENIREDQIVDFASTRYIRLFEKRESASR
jgi:hypothetical protein